MELSLAPLGRACRVVAVGGGFMLARRLMELGVFEGQELRPLRRAPLGDPLEIEVDHTFLVLRLSEARHVRVEVQP